MNERNNSFDLIRHVAAYMVLFSHHFILSGLHEPIFLKWETLGSIAVAIFFTISGYLMPRSFSGSSNFLAFMKKRCNRIFPGLIVCSFVMYFGIGFFFNTASPSDYISSGDALVKTLRNSVFIQEQIHGVFSNFKYKDIINGSLWTLPIEFVCYIIIGFFLSISNSWKSPSILLLIAIIATIAINYQAELYAYYAVPFKFLALFMIPFSTGALLSMTRSAWWNYRFNFLAIAALMLVAASGKPEIQIIGLLCVSLITVMIGTIFNEKIIHNKFDISYGVYIYAFPVQQIIINTFNITFYSSMFVSATITTIIAIASHKYIESRFTRRHKHLEKDIHISHI
ncbi:acyltransferase [Buttiauxella sp. B2]|uniref:acyltransferase family protein n=1 Tax=Buttiauxella sp. B2 TaxID=2587812 RepID=UPI0011248718|nr:acyltransferase [Buttiauxella sp. B2]TNV19021.1 acyltransferase [Buttiauxella sp. B2]